MKCSHNIVEQNIEYVASSNHTCVSTDVQLEPALITKNTFFLLAEYSKTLYFQSIFISKTSP